MSLGSVRWLGSGVRLCSRNVSGRTPGHSLSSYSVLFVSSTNSLSWSTRGLFKTCSSLTFPPVRRLSTSSWLSVAKKPSTTISQASLSKPLQALRYKARPASKKKPGGKVRQKKIIFLKADNWQLLGWVECCGLQCCRVSGPPWSRDGNTWAGCLQSGGSKKLVLILKNSFSGSHIRWAGERLSVCDQ